MRIALILACISIVGCGGSRPSWSVDPSPECRIKTPKILIETAKGTLLRWDFESSELPDSGVSSDPDYWSYRATVIGTGATLFQPAEFESTPRDEEERRRWIKEAYNIRLAYSGNAGEIRPISCLESLLFAEKHRRVDLLENEQEFIAQIVKRNESGRVYYRVYFGTGPNAIPDKSVYGLNEVKEDLDAGWTYEALLHNHTIRHQNGVPLLGFPAPSVVDVHFLRSLREEYGLRNALVTNGIYTIDIPAKSFSHYASVDDPE